MLTFLQITALMATLVTPSSHLVPSGHIVVRDSEPVFTVDLLHRMQRFADAYVKEPDSIKVDGSAANTMPIVIPVGKGKGQGVDVDMVAMARTYPSIAADLKTAGLTGSQWNADRSELFGLILTVQIRKDAGVDPKSVFGKNLAFYKEHENEFILHTGMPWPTTISAASDDDGGSHDMP